jgi:hypothetical protein
MYTGCNGATCIYAFYTIGRACICVNIMFLSLGILKRDFKSAQGNGKIPSMQVCIG